MASRTNIHEQPTTPGGPPARSAPRRAAITLIEVLISMGVLTIGILGVAALFPVGAFYAGRAEVADRADAAAAAALNDAVTRGLVDPENWVSYELPEDSAGPSWRERDATFRQGKRTNSTYTRPFAEDLRDRLAWPRFRTAIASRRQTGLNHQVGSIFFIDPVSVATGVNGPTQNAGPTPLRGAPASLYDGFGLSQLPASGSTAWWYTWYGTSAISRLSIARDANNLSGVAAIPLGMADNLTTISDDLAVELGEEADKPAQQRMLTSGGTPLHRQSDLHYSYLISVVPHTPEGRDALAYGGRGQAYDVTAVVFNRRPLNSYDPTDGFNGIQTLVRSERMCVASILSGGPNGGEVRLSASAQYARDAYFRNLADNPPWNDLKAGQYVMLFGPTPTSTPDRPALFAQWYRVVAQDDRGLAKDASGRNLLGPTLALRGPDWPWGVTSRAEPAVGSIGDYASTPKVVQDDLRVLILDGAVGAYSRTMRLDAGTAWSE